MKLIELEFVYIDILSLEQASTHSQVSKSLNIYLPSWLLSGQLKQSFEVGPMHHKSQDKSQSKIVSFFYLYIFIFITIATLCCLVEVLLFITLSCLSHHELIGK